MGECGLSDGLEAAKPIDGVSRILAKRFFFQDRLVAIFWLLALLLGAIQSLDISTTYIDPDAIAYLDIADAYLRGDWSTAINGLWPPLYSWILGLGTIVSHPSTEWEFPLLRLIDFLLYLFALGCFHFFLVQFVHYQQRRVPELSGEKEVSLPDWVWVVLGYGLFIWSSLSLITLNEDSPDMFVAGIVYLIVGIMLRIRMGSSKWYSFAILGGVLGIGYLAKAYLLYLAIIFLGLTAFSVKNLHTGFRGLLVALTTFLLVGSLYVVPLSITRGHLTFGEAGSLNYSYHINGIPYVHWQGGPPGNGIPKHPTRRVLENPTVYEFATPIGGTYPPWHDPVYWNEGATPHFSLRGQIGALRRSATTYFQTIVVSGSSLLVGFLILTLMGYRPWSSKTEHLLLLIPAVCALAMLSLVHVEPSHIGPYATLLWLGLFGGIRLPDLQEAKRLAVNTIIVVTVANLAVMGLPLLADARVTGTDIIRGKYHIVGYSQWQVAEALKAAGIGPGDRVAFLGDAFDDAWARLARVRVVAELIAKDVNDFWASDEAIKAKVMKTFADAGALAVVTKNKPDLSPMKGWKRISETNYFVYFLSK